MILSLILGAVAGVVAPQLEPKLADLISKNSKLRLDGGRLTVLAFAVALFAAGFLAELAGEAEAVWVVFGAVGGYFWKDIRNLIGK